MMALDSKTSLLAATLGILVGAGCSATPSGAEGDGSSTAGAGGSTPSILPAAGVSGASAGAGGLGGAPTAGSASVPIAMPGGAGGTGGATAGAGAGGAGGAGGSVATGTGGWPGYAGPPPHDPIDCGPDGWVVEDHGPPSNRVNYLILADGYDEGSIDTTLEQHIQTALDVRFNHEKGEPYGRYRKFVNICVAKVVSQNDGIGNGPTAFDGGNRR